MSAAVPGGRFTNRLSARLWIRLAMYSAVSDTKPGGAGAYSHSIARSSTVPVAYPDEGQMWTSESRMMTSPSSSPVTLADKMA